MQTQQVDTRADCSDDIPSLVRSAWMEMIAAVKLVDEVLRQNAK